MKEYVEKIFAGSFRKFLGDVAANKNDMFHVSGLEPAHIDEYGRFIKPCGISQSQLKELFDILNNKYKGEVNDRRKVCMWPVNDNMRWIEVVFDGENWLIEKL